MELCHLLMSVLFQVHVRQVKKKKIPSYLVLDINTEWDVNSSIVDCKLTVSCTTFQDFEVTEITLILHHDTAIA